MVCYDPYIIGFSIIHYINPTNQGFFRGSCSQKDPKTHCFASLQCGSMVALSLLPRAINAISITPAVRHLRDNTWPEVAAKDGETAKPIRTTHQPNLSLIQSLLKPWKIYMWHVAANFSTHPQQLTHPVVPSSDTSESGSNLLDGTYQGIGASPHV